MFCFYFIYKRVNPNGFLGVKMENFRNFEKPDLRNRPKNGIAQTQFQNQ